MYVVFRTIDMIVYPFRTLGYYLSYFVPGLKKLGKISAALKTGLLIFLFMLTVLTVFIISKLFFGSGEIGDWTWILASVAVMVVTPFVAYWGVRLLSAQSSSAFPDIDAAWRAGMEKLAELDLPIDLAPVQLVLGVGNVKRMRALMAEAMIESPFEMEGVPEGSPPLVWYASEEVIYLGLPGVGAVSRLVSDSEHTARSPTLASSSGQAPLGTAAVFDDEVSSAAALDEGADDVFVPPSSGPAMVPGRTIDLDEILDDTLESSSRPSAKPTSSLGGLAAHATLEERDRLTHVCRLLRKARSPLFPHNGVLIVQPLHSVLACGRSFEPAIRQDLDVLNEELQLRSTTSVLVTDLEREAGFLELMRRIGPNHCQSLRFGKGYSADSLPTPERLTAVALHACGAFEDFVYSLFGQRKALDKPGNHLLFMLMCKLRGRFRNVFVPTIAGSIGVNEKGGDLPAMFGGCYFAGTGDTPEQRSFLRAVFQKMDEQRLEVEWADEAIAVDDRYRNGANTIVLAGLVLLGWLVWQTWVGSAPGAQEAGLGERSIHSRVDRTLAQFTVQPGPVSRDNRNGLSLGPGLPSAGEPTV